MPSGSRALGIGLIALGLVAMPRSFLAMMAWQISGEAVAAFFAMRRFTVDLMPEIGVCALPGLAWKMIFLA